MQAHILARALSPSLVRLTVSDFPQGMPSLSPNSIHLAIQSGGADITSGPRGR